MGKHRRYQRKKHTSLAKPWVDDRDRREQLPPDLKQKQKLDEQPMPRKLRDLRAQIMGQKRSGGGGQPQGGDGLKAEQLASLPIAGKRKRKKRIGNRFLEETLKLGYHQRPWEDADRLLGRIARHHAGVVDAEMLKARLGNAGRAPDELAADQRALDDRDRLKRANRLATEERARKRLAKEADFRRRAKTDKKLAKRRLRAKNEEEEEDLGLALDLDERESIVCEGESEDEEGKMSSVEENMDEFGEAGGEEVSSLDKKEKTPKTKKVRRRDERRKELRADRRQAQAEALVLNAREVIPFGARVDAPPKFSGKLRDSLHQRHAQAGKKELLLKNLLVVEGETKAPSVKVEKKC